MSNKNLALKIGITFSLISFLLTFTFLIPIFSVAPGVIIESIASGLVDNEPYSNVGKLTIFIFTFILLVFFVLIFIGIKNIAQKKMELQKLEIVLIMSVFYLLIHPFGFYLYWGIVLNFKSDGQLIFAAVSSFPYSSLGFILLGLFIDFVWKKNYKILTSKK